MNGSGTEEINKFKITDNEGIDLFLDQNGNDPNNFPDDDREIEVPVISKKKIIVLVFSVLLFISAIIAAFIHLKNIREERIAFNKISSDFNTMIILAKNGDSSGLNRIAITEKLDSAVKHFKSILAEYPGDSRIEKMYAELVVNKFVFKFLSQVDQISENMISIDDPENEFAQALKFDSELSFVVDFIDNISLFLQYNSLYPSQPELATFPPHSWLVDTLSIRGKKISNLLKSNEIILREKFPVMYRYVKYIYNDIYPTVFIWQGFWEKYYQYHFSVDKNEKSRLVRGLQAQFPMLNIINDNISQKLYASQNMTIGISRSAVIPNGFTTHEKEWEPIIGFLKNKVGLNISLKVFTSEEELKSEFIEKRIDFAVFNNVVSGNLFSSNVGDPLLIRIWNTGITDNVIMITDSKDVKDLSELKGKKVSFSKNAFSAPYMYFYKKNVEPELYFSKITFAENSYTAIDNVVKGISDAAFVSSETFYYYQNANTNVNIYKNAVLTEQPLSILWARENLSSDIAQDFISILSSIDPKIIYSDMYPLLHPYGNWINFGQKLTQQYIKYLCVQSDIDVNSIFLMSMTTKDNIQKDKLMDAVGETLSDKGFVVVDVNSLNLPLSFIKHLDKYTLRINAEKNNDNIEYEFNFYWELRDTSELLFSKKFSQKAEIFPPNLSLPLQGLGSYLPVYVPVVKIENNFVKIRKPSKIELENGKIVNFYKIVDKDRNGFRGLFEEFTTEAFGEGKIVSVNDNEVIIKVNDQIRKLITTNDYAEIKF